MFKTITLSTDDGSFKLSSLIVNGKYEFPTFEIMDGNEITDIWDNVDYLLNNLYPYLKSELICPEFNDMFSNYQDELLEIFDEAIKMGFFIKNN